MPEAPQGKERYERLEKLGAGGIAVVYRARDRVLGRDVALKLLLPGVAVRPTTLARFRREGVALASLSHPNVVALHELLENPLALVLELVPGLPLSTILERGDQPLRSLLVLVAKVARGLQHAHERGIVHRDLKPANVLVTPEGEPKVADFGIARVASEEGVLTRTGDLVGTVGYMSPEQARGDPTSADPRTDVYALGVLLYEASTGQLPHTGGTIEVLAKIAHEIPVRPRLLKPSLSSDLEAIVLRALEKHPADRYPTAAAFASDLEAHLRGERPSTVVAARRSRAQKLAGAAFVAALVLVGATLLALRPGKPRLEEPPAEKTPRPTPTVSPVALVSSWTAAAGKRLLAAARRGDVAELAQWPPAKRGEALEAALAWLKSACRKNEGAYLEHSPEALLADLQRIATAWATLAALEPGLEHPAELKHMIAGWRVPFRAFSSGPGTVLAKVLMAELAAGQFPDSEYVELVDGASHELEAPGPPAIAERRALAERLVAVAPRSSRAARARAVLLLRADASAPLERAAAVREFTRAVDACSWDRTGAHGCASTLEEWSGQKFLSREELEPLARRLMKCARGEAWESLLHRVLACRLAETGDTDLAFDELVVASSLSVNHPNAIPACVETWRDMERLLRLPEGDSASALLVRDPERGRSIFALAGARVLVESRTAPGLAHAAALLTREAESAPGGDRASYLELAQQARAALAPEQSSALEAKLTSRIERLLAP